MSSPKKLVLYISEDCPHCEEAREAVNEIRLEEGVSVETRNIDYMESPPVTTAPSVCIVDENNHPVQCVLGIVSKDDFKTKIKHMLGSKTVV